MKRIVLTLAALLAVSCLATSAQAFHGLGRQRVVVQRQRVVVAHHRQAIVVAQPFVQAVYAQPVVAVQAYHAAPVVQQVVTPHCSSFFAR